MLYTVHVAIFFFLIWPSQSMSKKKKKKSVKRFPAAFMYIGGEIFMAVKHS